MFLFPIFFSLRSKGESFMKYDSIGKNIKYYRKLRKLRQGDLAEKADLSTNYIGMVERGEKIPSVESLISIANALSISTDMILCEELENGYLIRNSLLDSQLSALSAKERECIYAVIETLIKYSNTPRQ